MLYVIAFSFGLVDAFFHPAFMAMIPLIVDEDNLQATNSLMQGTMQLTQIAGPGIAGVLVNALGVALSFAFDAGTFLFTSIMLLLMPPVTSSAKSAETAGNKRGLFAEIGEMFAFVRADSALTALVLVSAAINLLFNGPLVVGSATLSQIRFVEGSEAFGAILSAFGLGALLGMLSGTVIHPKRIAVIGLALIAFAGVCMGLMGYVPTLPLACVLMALIGGCVGFTNVILITWIQKRIAKDMMGRVMSLLGLAGVGLAPISFGVAGALADLNVTLLFTLAGVLLVLTSVLAAFNRDVRAIEA
jgi:MFS family permease